MNRELAMPARSSRYITRAISLVALLLTAAGCDRPAATTAPQPQTVRCAVIGGMVDTELFVKVGERFHADTGDSVEIVATGPKGTVAAAVRDGKADLVTMHSSDTIVNLVADGYALDPQPWVRNELVIVGPSDDPAGIRGLDDAVEAFRRIAAARTPFVMHSSIGSQEVLRDILNGSGVQLDESQLVFSPEERKQMVLRLVEQKHAYTLVGRIPFLDG
jgi:tungstate transport system substrate-binding protein